MKPNKCKLSFRITRGNDVDPEHISKLLNAVPDLAHRRGDRHFSPDGKRELAPWSLGLWSLRSPEPDNSPIEKHFDWAESFAKQRRIGFEQLIAEKHDIELFNRSHSTSHSTKPGGSGVGRRIRRSVGRVEVW